MGRSLSVSASSSRKRIRQLVQRCIRRRQRRPNIRCGRRILWRSSGLLTASDALFPTEKGESLYQRPDGGLSKVTPGKTSLKFVQSHEQVAGLYRSPIRKIVRSAAQALALTLLLAGGTVYTLQHQHPAFTRPAALTEMPAAVISATRPGEDAFKISQVLRRYTRNGEVADRIANAVVA